MSLSVELDPAVVEALGAEPEGPKHAALECIVLELYRRGRLASGRAAEILGLHRAAFLDRAARLGLTYFNQSPEDLRAETEAALQAARRPA
jgi:hypothetical protein